MRFTVILNEHGGTLRTMDIAAFSEQMVSTLGEAGHQVRVKAVSGKEIETALDEAVAGDAEVVLVGGGDGTISAAAGRLMNTDKVLAILPAGTMNLFARSLGIPLELDQAIAAFAHGRIASVDMGSANGRPFVHQFSIGLHPHLIDMRDRLCFRSKIGKIMASSRAAFFAFLNPPRLRLAVEMQGRVHNVVTSSVGVTNNLFGEGHLPFAEWPAEGVLGIYITRARRRRDLAIFLVNLGLGRWRKNDQVSIETADQVVVTVRTPTRRFKCAIDGELCPLEARTELKIHPAALKVLVPAAPDGVTGSLSSR